MADLDDMDMPSRTELEEGNWETRVRLREQLLRIDDELLKGKAIPNPDEPTKIRLRRLKVTRRSIATDLMLAEKFSKSLQPGTALFMVASERLADTPVSDSATSAEVPRAAEFMLDLLLSPKEQETGIGDLHEGYAKRVVKFGTGRAKRWVYMQVLRSAAPLLWRLVSLGWIVEWIRRQIS